MINYNIFFIRFIFLVVILSLTLFFILLDFGVWSFVFLSLGSLGVFVYKDSKISPKHNARFANQRDTEQLTKNALNGEGILIGFAYKKPLAITAGIAGKRELGHAMWVGPSRSGKGLSISSNLYNWEDSALIVDIKGEIAEQTAGYRREVLGQRVFILNPSSGEKSHQFDPFRELETDEQIFAAAIAFLNPESDGSNAVFAERASSILAAIIKAAKILDEPVISYLGKMLYHPQGVEGVAKELIEIKNDTLNNWVFSFVGGNPEITDWDVAAGDKFLMNSWQRLVTSSSYLVTDGIMHMTGGSDFTAADLIADKTTVYLIFRESELALNQPLFNLVIDSIFRSIMRQYDLNPTMRGRKVLTIFDEAFRAKPESLAEYTATVAGRGIYLSIYVQSLAQIADVWGEEGKTAIMENVHTKIFLPAVDRAERDKDGTAAYVSQSCGQYMVENKSASKDEHEHEINSNVSLVEKQLITADEFSMLPLGQSIVFTNNLPPILAYRLEPWKFREHKEAERLKIPEIQHTPNPYKEALRLAVMKSKEKRSQVEKEHPDRFFGLVGGSVSSNFTVQTIQEGTSKPVQAIKIETLSDFVDLDVNDEEHKNSDTNHEDKIDLDSQKNVKHQSQSTKSTGTKLDQFHQLEDSGTGI